MPSPRLRAKDRNLDGAFPISLDEEVADLARGIVHEDFYTWGLCKHLLYAGVRHPENARTYVQQAREHEARMWARFPSGPATVAGGAVG